MTEISFEEKLEHLNDILDDKTYVLGEIYMITNLINGKVYVGQTLTHHLNHKKYRPYGYLQRFKDHVSAAYNNKTGCTYLNNAIRKYKAENFNIELICRCESDEDTDDKEIYYIDFYSSLYPNGYNLTEGGKANIAVVQYEIEIDPTVPPKQPYQHSKATKQKMSLRSQEFSNTDEMKELRSDNAQSQHDKAKLEKFKDCRIDHSNLEQYIHPVISTQTLKVSFYKVYVNGVRTVFRSKTVPVEKLKERAIAFLKQLPSISQCTSSTNSSSSSSSNPLPKIQIKPKFLLGKTN